MYGLILLVSVYSPFSDRVGLPLHNILFQFLSVMDIFFVDLSSVISAYTLSNHVLLGLPTGLLPSTLNCCSSNLIAVYEPHTSGSPFPCTQATGYSLQSSGIHPSLTMMLIRSVIQLVRKPPYAFTIQLTTPAGPAAFPILIQHTEQVPIELDISAMKEYVIIIIAAASSCSKMRQQGSLTSGQSTSPSQLFSTFGSFSIYFLLIDIVFCYNILFYVNTNSFLL